MEPEKARRYNRAAVLDAVFNGSMSTRAALCKATSLSAATVSRVVDDLLADGVLAEGARIPASGRGRPTATIDLSPNTGCVMGLDMGLSTTTSTFVDLQGRILGEDRTLTAIAGSSKSMLAKTIDRITRMRDAHDIDIPLVGLTISVPAVVTDSGEVLSIAEGIDLAGDRFRARLQDALGVPVRLINDARASLIGEAWLGAAVGTAHAALLMLSTEVSMAALIDGEVLPQRSPNSASYGSLPFDGGRLGDYLSTRGLRSRVPALDVTNPDYTVVHREPAHRRTSEHFLDAAVLLAVTAAMTFDSEVVIFTGRLTNLTRMMLPAINERVRETLLQPPLLVVSEMRGRAGALGSARHAMDTARGRLKERQLEGRGPSVAS
ncbi:ROK family protein [Mycolicibacterium boenickei]